MFPLVKRLPRVLDERFRMKRVFSWFWWSVWYPTASRGFHGILLLTFIFWLTSRIWPELNPNGAVDAILILFGALVCFYDILLLIFAWATYRDVRIGARVEISGEEFQRIFVGNPGGWLFDPLGVYQAVYFVGQSTKLYVAFPTRKDMLLAYSLVKGSKQAQERVCREAAKVQQRELLAHVLDSVE